MFRSSINLTMLTLPITCFLVATPRKGLTTHSLQDKMSYGTKTPTSTSAPIQFQSNSIIVVDDALNIIYHFEEMFYNRDECIMKKQMDP